MKEQIEEKNCKECLHYEMCLKKFRKAKDEGLWELTEEDEYFAHADECDFYAAGYHKQSEGEWVEERYIDEKRSDFKCSVCEFDDTFYRNSINRFYKYCPNCGAKMKGATDERE